MESVLVYEQSRIFPELLISAVVFIACVAVLSIIFSSNKVENKKVNTEMISI